MLLCVANAYNDVDAHCEYDADDEDFQFLDQLNATYHFSAPLKIDVIERMIDRFEKERAACERQKKVRRYSMLLRCPPRHATRPTFPICAATCTTHAVSLRRLRALWRHAIFSLCAR